MLPPRELETGVHVQRVQERSTAMLFVVAKIWKQLRRSRGDERIKKMCVRTFYVQMQYSAV